jgi:hypothetical protein
MRGLGVSVDCTSPGRDRFGIQKYGDGDGVAGCNAPADVARGGEVETDRGGGE